MDSGAEEEAALPHRGPASALKALLPWMATLELHLTLSTTLVALGRSLGISSGLGASSKLSCAQVSTRWTSMASIQPPWHA